MELNKLSDLELETSLKNLVKLERDTLTHILHHLREVEVRRLHLRKPYDSLVAYAINELGYQEKQAYRRISAMRLLNELPELERSLQSGAISETQVSQLCIYFNSEKKKNKPLTKNQKLDIVTELQHKSTRETDKIFAKLDPLAVTRDRERMLTETLTEIRFVASDALLQKLKRFRELDSHELTHPTYAELIERLVDIGLHFKEGKLKSKSAHSIRTRPSHLSAPVSDNLNKQTKVITGSNQAPDFSALRKTSFVRKTEIKSSCSAPSRVAIRKSKLVQRSRYIPISVKREVYLRDEGACTFSDPLTQKRCGSRNRIQYDHLIAYALGGDHSARNLTLRCQAHNLYSAEQIFGREKVFGAKLSQ